MNSPRCPEALIIGAIAFLLVGCNGPTAGSSIPIPEPSARTPDAGSSAPDQIAALSEPRSEKDHLPAVFLDGTLPLIGDSARLLADHDGVRYYVGRGTNPDDVCLMVYGSPESFHSMCTSSLPFQSEALGLGRTQLVGPDRTPLRLPDETAPSDGWLMIADNLIIMK